MAGGQTGGRKSQMRSKQRARDSPGAHNRWRQTEPPWRPEDDYLLIHSVYLTSNLAEVYACVRFTKPYTQKEIEHRWSLLLFNPTVSKIAREAIANMPQYVKSQLDGLIPFSRQEDAILLTVSCNDVYKDQVDKYSVFEKLLRENLSVFYSTRTPVHLYKQWSLLRRCHLIAEHENDKVSEVGGDPESFSDTEFLIQETTARVMPGGIASTTNNLQSNRLKRLLATDDTYHGFQAVVNQAVADSLAKRPRSSSFSASPSVGGANRSTRRSPTWSGSRSDANNAEQATSRNSNTEEISALIQRERHRARKRLHTKMTYMDEESKRWVALVESWVANGYIVSDNEPIFPTLATLTGSRTTFFISQKVVTFGRAARDFTPDIDLSREGEASKVSRRHGKITLSDDGVFWLTNYSKHPVFVDAQPVLKGQRRRLAEDSVVCISHLFLHFNVEHEHLSMLSTVKRTATASENLDDAESSDRNPYDPSADVCLNP